MNYVNNTYILEAALNLGVKVFNNPAALRDDNEKLSILRYPNLITQTIVSSSKSIIEKFINNHNEVVIKPLGLMGGQGIERIKLGDKNLDNLLNKISEKQEKMMIQKFIPEVFEGDKRVLLIDGEDCGFAVSRIPQGDDFRGNLAAGGKAEVVDHLIPISSNRVRKELGVKPLPGKKVESQEIGSAHISNLILACAACNSRKLQSFDRETIHRVIGFSP